MRVLVAVAIIAAAGIYAAWRVGSGDPLLPWQERTALTPEEYVQAVTYCQASVSKPELCHDIVDALELAGCTDLRSVNAGVSFFVQYVVQYAGTATRESVRTGIEEICGGADPPPVP